ncbi:MAG: hypothetical protein EZS28_041762 [Streblomastix strix]|uniref:Uncharacterized protein n=1 Tax=Streblomastix strix TaxID=222440 RepID=A0A5J4TYJ3_9EUKA|nr:MAG: hypothetical protein EZS28_041762 [Streblomastix strix]
MANRWACVRFPNFCYTNKTCKLLGAERSHILSAQTGQHLPSCLLSLIISSTILPPLNISVSRFKPELEEVISCSLNRHSSVILVAVQATNKAIATNYTTLELINVLFVMYYSRVSRFQTTLSFGLLDDVRCSPFVKSLIIGEWFTLIILEDQLRVSDLQSSGNDKPVLFLRQVSKLIFAIRVLTVPLSKPAADLVLVLVERDPCRSGQLSWEEIQISGLSPVQPNEIAFLLTTLRSCYGLQYLQHRFIVRDAKRSIVSSSYRNVIA